MTVRVEVLTDHLISSTLSFTTMSASSSSLLVAWQLKDKRVLVVGGGEVAAGRVESVLCAQALITILSPLKGLHLRTKELIMQHPDRITHYDRRFSGPSELHKMDMVLVAIDDVNRSHEIVDHCRQVKIPVNAADLPDHCDFYFGAQIRDGPLQIMISTSGNGPRMAALIKATLQKALTGNEGIAVAKVGQLREKLKERASGVGGVVSRKRMKWMTQLCDTWDMQDFCLLDDATQIKLLNVGWEQGRIPTAEEITGRRRWPTISRSCLLPSAVGFAMGAVCTALVILSRRR